MRNVLIVSAVVFSSGCALAPHGVRPEVEHVSHPSVGWPSGPSNEEDTLNQASLLFYWHYEGLLIEIGPGYKLANSGFYGPPLTATVRVSKDFAFNSRR